MALASDRNTREFTTFTLGTTGDTALNVFGVGTGTGTATATSTGLSLMDVQFRMFTLGTTGGVAINTKST